MALATHSSLEYWSGGHLPRSELEVDDVEIDAAHTVAQMRAVADFLERILPVELFDRRSAQSLVDIIVGGTIVFDDVLFARDQNARRQQAHRQSETNAQRHAPSPAVMAAVVDKVDLAALARTPVAADQPPVGVHYREHLAIAAIEDGHGRAVVAPLGARIARDTAEACRLVVPDDGPIALAHDDATVRLLDHAALAAGLDSLAPPLLHVFEARGASLAGTVPTLVADAGAIGSNAKTGTNTWLRPVIPALEAADRRAAAVLHFCAKSSLLGSPRGSPLRSRLGSDAGGRSTCLGTPRPEGWPSSWR